MTTCRYEAVTSAKISRMTPASGRISVNAASPAAGRSSIKICSGPYAVDETASGEKAPSAMGFERLSCSRSSLISGFPKKNRFHASMKVDGALCSSAGSTTVMLFPALTLAIFTKNLRPRTLASLSRIRLPEGVPPATISANYHLSRTFVLAPNRRELSQHRSAGLRFSGGFGRLTRALVVSHPKRLGNPRSHVVGQNLRAHVRDPADHPGHLVRGAVMEQPVRQWRIHPARQQGRHRGVRVITLDLRNQLLGSTAEVSILAIDHQ